MKKIINSIVFNNFLWKFDLKMKLTTLFVVVSLFQLKANDSYSQTTKLSLDMNHVMVNDVIRKIESLSEFKFLYNRKDVDLNRFVSIRVKKKRITAILSSIFLDSDTKFEVFNKQIVLKRFKEQLKTELLEEQEREIKGIVKDDKGNPLSGANVLVKGTTIGTQTGFDGDYTISVNIGQTLIFTYIGQKQVIRVVGTQNVINVQMEEDAQALDEVVVTALGITRDKRSLGYSTQEVKGDDLNTVKSGNFVNAISGKVSGIQIKRNNNFGGSTNVVIRGNTSLTGSNQALFVIDGVPISNTNTNAIGQTNGRGGYFDYGSAASDINPENIESVNVLKGAAASALYGSRAANGVIMITTKKGKSKGKESKGYGITINSGITTGFIDKSTFAKYQDKYGAGYGHYYGGPDSYWLLEDIKGDGTKDDQTVPFTEDASYGAPFDPNLLVYQWDSFDPDSPNYKKPTPWVNAKNGPITFFETPLTITNSVSLDKGTEDGYYRLNYTNFDQKGLMPNSSIKKHDFSTSGTFKIMDKLTATGYANFIKTNGRGRNRTGYSGGNIIGMFKQWWQTNVDLKDQRDIYFATKRNISWNPATSDPGSVPIFWNNTYWTRFENYQTDTRSRFIGNISLNYQLTSWLNVTGRVATDTYSELQEERRANGSVAGVFGIPDAQNNLSEVGSGYARRNINNYETNYDLMFNFNKDLNAYLNLKGILGWNIRRNHFQSVFSTTSGGLNIPELYSLQNSVDPLALPKEKDKKIGVDGVYVSSSLGYKNILYFDATIRKDHSSTLPKDNSVFYYPSFAGSFVFSNILESEILSFGKVRLNYAEVGNSAPFDNLYDSYNVSIPPGSASTSVKSTKNNPDLKPEKTKSFEAGLEIKFFHNRLSLDVAYYKTNSVNQIFGVPVSTSTGYSFKRLNAGEIENKGIELTLIGTPIETETFSWNSTINWTKNRNKVISLVDGIENLQLGSFQGGITINARVGQPYGVLQGSDYTYLKGNKIIDASNGQYIETTTSDKVIGDTNPNWLMGIANSFSYKKLTLSFLIDIQKGGSIFSLDQYYGLATGMYEETAYINDLGKPVRNLLANGGGFINEGVNKDGSKNTTRIRADRFGALGYRRGLPDKAFVYDASFVKLRELSITYDFPKDILKNVFLTDALFSVIGSNLWIIHKNTPHEDPEGGLGAGNLQGFSASPMPTTKNVGFNLKLQF